MKLFKSIQENTTDERSGGGGSSQENAKKCLAVGFFLLRIFFISVEFITLEDRQSCWSEKRDSHSDRKKTNTEMYASRE